MKYIVLLSLFITGCFNSSKFKIGQKVTNGLCEGYISEKYSSYAVVRPFDCLEVQYKYVVIDYDELQVVE